MARMVVVLGQLGERCEGRSAPTERSQSKLAFVLAIAVGAAGARARPFALLSTPYKGPQKRLTHICS